MSRIKISMIILILSVLVYAYTIVPIYETSSFKFYEHNVLTISDGYTLDLKTNPLTSYLLFGINLVTNNITISMRVLVVICLALTMREFVASNDMGYWVVSLIICFNPLTHLMVQAALMRNVVGLVFLAILISELRKFDKDQTNQKFQRIALWTIMIFFVHNLTLAVAVGIVVTYFLGADIPKNKKLIILIISGLTMATTIYLVWDTVIVWMIATFRPNWPRIYETMVFVPIATSLFSFVVTLVYPKDRVMRTIGVVGILLHFGTWLMPEGIGIRLLYYTPLLLAYSMYNNYERRKNMGLQTYLYFLALSHFLTLLIS